MFFFVTFHQFTKTEVDPGLLFSFDLRDWRDKRKWKIKLLIQKGQEVNGNKLQFSFIHLTFSSFDQLKRLSSLLTERILDIPVCVDEPMATKCFAVKFRIEFCCCWKKLVFLLVNLRVWFEQDDVDSFLVLPKQKLTTKEKIKSSNWRKLKLKSKKSSNDLNVDKNWRIQYIFLRVLLTGTWDDNRCWRIFTYGERKYWFCLIIQKSSINFYVENEFLFDKYDLSSSFHFVVVWSNRFDRKSTNSTYHVHQKVQRHNERCVAKVFYFDSIENLRTISIWKLFLLDEVRPESTERTTRDHSFEQIHNRCYRKVQQFQTNSKSHWSNNWLKQIEKISMKNSTWRTWRWKKTNKSINIMEKIVPRT